MIRTFDRSHVKCKKKQHSITALQIVTTWFPNPSTSINHGANQKSVLLRFELLYSRFRSGAEPPRVSSWLNPTRRAATPSQTHSKTLSTHLLRHRLRHHQLYHGVVRRLILTQNLPSTERHDTSATKAGQRALRLLFSHYVFSSLARTSAKQTSLHDPQRGKTTISLFPHSRRDRDDLCQTTSSSRD